LLSRRLRFMFCPCATLFRPCGKTTFLRVSADLEQPTTGTIAVNGMTPSEARVKRAYGYVFQAPALYPWRTIEKNVALPLEIIGRSEEHTSALQSRENLVCRL